MEIKLQLEYNQILDLIYQLPKNDFENLLPTLQNKYYLENLKKTNSKTKLQELLLKAPTWSDIEYNDFLKTKQHLTKLRSK